jgi:hypothetical protein
LLLVGFVASGKELLLYACVVLYDEYEIGTLADD